MTAIEIIKQYAALNGETVKVQRLKQLLQSLQSCIIAGTITKRSKHADLIETIQDSLLQIKDLKDTDIVQVSVKNSIEYLRAIASDEIDKKIDANQPVNLQEFNRKKFDLLGFTGKWLRLIGNPEKRFKAAFWGVGGSGKSTLVIQFTGYLAVKFNLRVLFVCNEEKGSFTLQEKFIRLGVNSKNIDIVSNLPADVSAYDVIVIDSVTTTGVIPADIESIYAAGKIVLYILQVTKGGAYKGVSDFQHIADVFVKIDNGEAIAEKSRFGGYRSINVFSAEKVTAQTKQDKPKKSDGKDFTHTNLNGVEPEQQYIVTDERKKKRKPLNKLAIFDKKGLTITVLKHGSITSNGLVKNVSVSDIHTAVGLFQNRVKEFSEESVQRILQAVKNDTFKLEVFDPVLLWKHPETGKLYILSGHSRTEAFRRLSKDNKDFAKIPAKIIEVSQAEAVKIALNSNTLSTRERDTERAIYYRNLRKEGVKDKDIKTEANEHEGKNAAFILSLSYLNPKGHAFDALETFTENTDKTSQEVVKSVSNWLGEARRQFDKLTNAHENELFDYMVTGGGYGSKTGQISNKQEFLQKVSYLVERQGVFFDESKPLNVKNLQQKSSFEKDYESKVHEIEKELKEAKSLLDRKRSEYIARKVEPEQRDKLLKQYEADVQQLQKKYIEVKNSHSKYIEAERNQKSLFDGVKKRKL